MSLSNHKFIVCYLQKVRLMLPFQILWREQP